MDILTFSENLKTVLKEKLTELNLQEDDMTKIGNAVTLTIADELVKKYVGSALANIQIGTFQSSLKWTASKTALIELVYALHHAKAIDGGESDVKPIAEAMEKIFNINLGNYYRVFQDVRSRKGNSTSFLDELRQKLQQYITSIDA